MLALMCSLDMMLACTWLVSCNSIDATLQVPSPGFCTAWPATDSSLHMPCRLSGAGMCQTLVWPAQTLNERALSMDIVELVFAMTVIICGYKPPQDIAQGLAQNVAWLAHRRSLPEEKRGFSFAKLESVGTGCTLPGHTAWQRGPAAGMQTRTTRRSAPGARLNLLGSLLAHAPWLCVTATRGDSNAWQPSKMSMQTV
jgi:hypothetical protein